MEKYSSSTRDALRWRDIEQLLEEIGQLPGQGLSQEIFYQQLLERTRRATSAEEAAVWEFRDGELACVARHGQKAVHSAPLSSTRWASARAAWKGQTTSDLPDGRGIFEPVFHEGRPIAMLEVVMGETASAESVEGAVRFLHVVGDFVADYFLRQQIGRYQRCSERSQDLLHLSQQCSKQPQLQPLSYALVNDGRGLFHDAILSIVVRKRSRWRVIACSGVDVIERGAAKVRKLEELARSTAKLGDPLWWPCPTGDLAPQVDMALQEYLDVSQARRMGVIPIADQRSDRSQSIDVVCVAEVYQETPEREFRDSLTALCQVSQHNLYHAMDLDRVPLSDWLLSLGRPRRSNLVRRFWAALALLIVVVVVAGMVLIPATLRIPAQGSLMPAQRRHIFAPEDAVVEAVLVEHGRPVEADQPVVKLRQAQLSLKMSQTLGDLQVAQQRLHSVRAKRWVNTLEGSSVGAVRNEAVAEEVSLRERVEGLEHQLELLRVRAAGLELKSPIDGQVLTWNVRQLLEARPVRRGQRLLTVADPTGDWVLELSVADREIGHILDALIRLGGELPVRFSLATQPATSYTGRLVAVAERTDVSGDRAIVPLLVRIDSSTVTPLRSGSEVAASIDCGRRSLGYVWFRDVIDNLVWLF